ncbi:hypothetical protein IC608_14250 [Devosia sp. PTR5]|jgi:hypothetical protein|uniref:Uncharacterized protein n=1 Tax=Devosia oryzisoli TaxID=2774138 RepID=A0A927IU75_9HYPH|nr:hypothetical protein [Devosia oryzisoli]MBD8066632.1 hypothetical protein [Devosia oryzisoli]
MTPTSLIRQSHRWISLFFTLTVIANFVALFAGRQMDWLTYLPLLPLFLLIASGTVLFFQPYVRKAKARRAVA